ncbi:ANM_collapsed_G0058590.mRNA.1.CDS.1 [Saccharomyces cerevisiae]|nr:ANM_collapsed_G0058590.mRNA.1.CDS.1 [Saccharomyces cerevisiae]
MITSPMAEKEIASRKMFLQLEAFLKINGFAIKNEDLKKIVEHSKGNPILLVKNLLLIFVGEMKFSSSEPLYCRKY